MEKEHNNIWKLLAQRKPPDLSLSNFDLLILSAINELGPVGACCGTIQKFVEEMTDTNLRLATLYAVVTSLEGKGLVQSEVVSSRLRGRPKKVYAITPVGNRALRLAENMVPTDLTQVVSTA